MCNFSMQIQLGKINVNYCVCQGQARSMSRSFDINLDKISEFYQAFNICAVQVFESSKMIADNF